MGSFTPLVFSTSGGMSKTTTTAYKRLASLLADKHDQPYSTVMAWLRINLSFSLLRSAITCLRGARSVTKKMARVKNGPPGPSFSAKIGPPLQKLARARLWSLRVI